MNPNSKIIKTIISFFSVVAILIFVFFLTKDFLSSDESNLDDIFYEDNSSGNFLLLENDIVDKFLEEEKKLKNFSEEEEENKISLPGCQILGYDLDHGKTKLFYSKNSVPMGEKCNYFAKERTCDKGFLLGDVSYPYENCIESNSCVSESGKVFENGRSVTFYSEAKVPHGLDCKNYSQVRTCADGIFSGNSEYNFLTCQLDEQSGCLFDGEYFSEGTSRGFYSKDSLPYGEFCSDNFQLKTCTGGVFMGDDIYNKGSCKTEGASGCSIDGVFLEHGQSADFYTDDFLSYTENCQNISQVRTCSNGFLSGSNSYSHSSCEVKKAENCFVKGEEIASGSSKVFYSQENAEGGICVAYAQNRYCEDGVLSGDNNYTHSTCN